MATGISNSEQRFFIILNVFITGAVVDVLKFPFRSNKCDEVSRVSGKVKSIIIREVYRVTTPYIYAAYELHNL